MTVREASAMDATKHVLWVKGDERYGVQPGTFEARLLALLSAADLEHLELLREVAPAYVRAWEIARTTWGIDTLRTQVKAELDRRDRGLDFASLSAAAGLPLEGGA